MEKLIGTGLSTRPSERGILETGRTRSSSGLPAALFERFTDRMEHTEDVFFFQAEDGIRDVAVTGVQTCALPISPVVSQNTRHVRRSKLYLAASTPLIWQRSTVFLSPPARMMALPGFRMACWYTSLSYSYTPDFRHWKH